MLVLAFILSVIGCFCVDYSILTVLVLVIVVNLTIWWCRLTSTVGGWVRVSGGSGDVVVGGVGAVLFYFMPFR